MKFEQRDCLCFELTLSNVYRLVNKSPLNITVNKSISVRYHIYSTALDQSDCLKIYRRGITRFIQSRQVISDEAKPSWIIAVRDRINLVIPRLFIFKQSDWSSAVE